MIGQKLHEGTCPRCGSADVTYVNRFRKGASSVHWPARCETCGYTWTDVFSLTDQNPRGSSATVADKVRRIAKILSSTSAATEGFSDEENRQLIYELNNALLNAIRRHADPKEGSGNGDSGDGGDNSGCGCGFALVPKPRPERPDVGEKAPAPESRPSRTYPLFPWLPPELFPFIDPNPFPDPWRRPDDDDFEPCL